MKSAYRAGLRRFLPFAAVILLAAPLAAQEAAEDPANYRLAARFAPYKIQNLVYSTSVDPQWIEGSESFWYEWESSDGSFYYLVDPVAGAKRQIFDNDRIAAELTRITRDPWDGQHLPIRSIRFIDANTLQFEVESSQDEEEDETESEMEELDEEEEEGEEQRRRARKKVFHF
ncbi:MAG: S9 family peptidase, partial [Acidimicrobiia bacterium]|nr:S9 family peptidase [Acidimicrobiia bacterium]